MRHSQPHCALLCGDDCSGALAIGWPAGRWRLGACQHAGTGSPHLACGQMVDECVGINVMIRGVTTSPIRIRMRQVRNAIRAMAIVGLAVLPLLLAVLMHAKMGAGSFALHDPELGEARRFGLPNPFSQTPRAHSAAI